ncbi:MAG: NAD-dependent deacetylase [Candidatus Odinarchaeota archaeon]
MSIEPIEKLVNLIVESKKTVALTGAGISTEPPSNIPDFRSPGGLWEKFDPNQYATWESFLTNPERFWELALEVGGILFDAHPNPAHVALAELEELGKLEAIVTQNIDGLHQVAGNSRVYELHGNFRYITCIKCHDEFMIDEGYVNGFINTEGLTIPRCRKDDCNGIMKSKAVLFNEPIPLTPLANAKYLMETCELLLVLGTSLNVYPAAVLPDYALKKHARIAVINYRDQTDIERNADVVIRELLGETLPVVVEKVRARLK